MHIQAVAYFRNSEGIVVTNANKLNPAAFDEHEVLFTAPTYGDAQLLRRRLGWNDGQDAHSQYGRAKHAARGRAYRAIITASPLESEPYDELAPCLFEGEGLEGRHFLNTTTPEPKLEDTPPAPTAQEAWTLTYGETLPYAWAVYRGTIPCARFVRREDALDYLAQLLKDKDNHKTQGGHDVP